MYHNNQDLVFYSPKTNKIMIAPGDKRSYFNSWLKRQGFVIIGIV